MSVISLECPRCGGPIIFLTEKGICSYCGQPYKIEDPNKGYNNTSVGHLNGDEIVESQIRAAETFIKLGDYESARKKLLDVTENHPDNYQGWWGLVRVCTCDFKKTILTYEEYRTIQNYYRNAEKVCENNHKIKGVFSDYKERVLCAAHEKCQELERQIKDEEQQLLIRKQQNIQSISDINTEIDSLIENMNKLKKGVKQIRQPDYGDYKCYLTIPIIFEIAAIINAFSDHHLFSGFVSAILVFLGWLPGLLVGYIVDGIVLIFAKENYKAVLKRNEELKSAINDYETKIWGLKSQKGQYENNTQDVELRIRDLKEELNKYNYCKT